MDTKKKRPIPKQITHETHRPDLSPTASARSGRSILATQVLRLAVRVGGTVTLARLISPLEYGIFGMAATVHGFAYVFQDFGLSTVTIRKPDLSESERSALFWLNLGLGAALTVVVSTLGLVAAAFFKEPALRLMLPATAATFIVNGAHTQLRAQLARDHRFIELNRIEIGAFTASTLIAIGLAWLGAGAWALVGMLVSAEVAIAVGVWMTQPWRPGYWPRGIRAGSLLHSGAGLSANDGLRYTQRNVDLFLVGRWFGAGALGVYGRAAQMASLPAFYVGDPLSNLAVSSLRHLSGSPSEARAFWRRLVNNLAWITVPAAAVFACLPREMIGVLLGARWTEGASVLRALSIGLCLLPLGMGCGWLFLAGGRNRRLLAWSGLATALPVVACLVLHSAGPSQIALGMGVATAVSALSGIAFIRPADLARPRDALAAMARPLVSGAALAVLLVLALHFAPALGLVQRLGISIGVSAAWVAALWLAWPAAREEWREHFLWRR